MIEKLAPWVAGLVYGGWSAFSNWEHGTETALLAFVIQGAFAFTSTFVLGKLVNYAANKFSHIQSTKKRFVTVNLTGSTFLWATPTTLHLIAGTPNIILAMLPGLVVGHIYLFTITKKNPLLKASA